MGRFEVRLNVLYVMMWLEAYGCQSVHLSVCLFLPPSACCLWITSKALKLLFWHHVCLLSAMMFIY